MNDARRAIRQKREQLLTLVNNWDPIGLVEAGAPRNEYDCVVDKLFGALSRKATKAEVARFLEQEISDHFGVAPRDVDAFANRVVAWYLLDSSELDSDHDVDIE